MRFRDLKEGFGQIFADKNWFWKVLLGGFLLINPLMLGLLPVFLSGEGADWVPNAFFALLALNVITFWFPLGFTYEVLRRARSGQGTQLPSWNFQVLPRYAKEGAVKLVLAITTLLLPIGVWMGLWSMMVSAVVPLDFQGPIMGLLTAPILWLVIPFCGVACCRWLDGASVLSCAFNYAENIRLFKKGCPDYLLASVFLIGVNSVTTSLFYTIPFAAVFGLCLVDTWFGPIYAETVRKGE
jgi:hypothetical protein